MKENLVFNITKVHQTIGIKLRGGADYGGPVTIGKIVPGSSAEKSGLKKNDIILAINNQSLHGANLKTVDKILNDSGQTVNIQIERISEPENVPLFTRRFQIAVMAFLGFMNIYALRVNLSVAIVAMTKNQTFTSGNITTTTIAEFDWDTKTQGWILSAFFYGYITTQVIGGWFATRFGGKLIFGVGVFVTASFTIITPFLARTNIYLLILARFVEGFFEGVTYPAMHAVWARWAPPSERSKLATFAISGSSFGNVIALPMCGWIAQKLGWPSIFYVFGVLGVLWTALWWGTVGESPKADKFINDSERTYIESTTGHTSNKNIEMNVPWIKILLAPPVWAIMIANFTENWGVYTLLTQLPTYMSDVFEFEIQNAGILSALPYLAMGIAVPIGGQVADFLRRRKYLTTTQVRKTMNCTAFLFQGAFLLVAAHATSAAVVITALSTALCFGGLSLSGFAVNHLDIAPQYAGILFGLSNTIGTAPGIITPALTGYLVQNKTTEEWKLVFYVAASIYLIGSISYGLLASGKVQKWAMTKDTINIITTENIPLNTKSNGVDDDV